MEISSLNRLTGADTIVKTDVIDSYRSHTAAGTPQPFYNHLINHNYYYYYNPIDSVKSIDFTR